MNIPTNDQRERILRCRKQAQEVERLGLLMEAAQTFLPARLHFRRSTVHAGGFTQFPIR